MKKKPFTKWLIGAFALSIAIIQPVSDSSDTSPLHTVVTAEAATAKPGKVPLSSIKATAFNKIQISWKKTSNATHYRIYYKIPGGSWKLITTVGADKTSYIHKSSAKYPIRVGQNYTYTVRAYNSKTKRLGSYDSQGLTARTLPSIVYLKDLQLNEDNTVTVSWRKAYGANTYRIYRKTASSPKWKLIGTSKSTVYSYTDMNPVKGEENIYTVRFYNSNTKAAGKYDTAGLSVNVPSATEHTHIYQEEIIRPATCIEDGEKLLTCTICHETKTERIPATGQHNWVNKGTDVAMSWQDENGIQLSNEESVTGITCCVVCGYFYGNIAENEDLFITRYYQHTDEPGPCYGRGYMSVPVYARYELYECPDCYSYKRGKLAYYHYHWYGSFEHTLTQEEIEELGLPLPEL